MTVVETMSAGPGSGMGPTGGPMDVANSGSVVTTPSAAGLNPAVVKTSQEIITLLHLIKDIRRLEKYQRDFFLKVKESLNHVHMLLDHQLMDMAWSDNLTDCEENLLKVSTHLQVTSSSQLAELYSILIRDKEKLSTRFQELSVKSSLSEFVVNSRALLDLHNVQVAAEAILKNEKPLPARGDQSIPIDHTFFLANFCTASLASSMMSNFIPKPAGAMATPPTYSPQTRPYDKNVNGSLPQPPQQQPANGTEMPQTPVKAGVRQLSQQGDYSAAHQAPASPRTQQQQPQQPPTASSAIYDDKYNIHQAAEKSSDLSNGIYGHELLAAITQIARREDHSAPPTNKVTSSGGVPKMSRVDPWGNADGPMPPQQQQQQQQHQRGSGGTGRYASGTSNSNVTSLDPNDGSSDEISSVSEDASGDQATGSGGGGSGSAADRNKPLSFARIASLNLEKQQQQLQAAGVGSNRVHKRTPSGNTGGGNLPTLQSAIADRMLATTPPSLNDAANALGPMVYLPPTKNPRYFFDIVMEGQRLGRVIIEVDPMAAPKMTQNFHSLVTGEKGYGYRGCQFFQVWKNESVICGDWEYNSGRGGRAALDDGPLFTPDETKLPCTRGAVGMRRMSKKHSSLNEVASQFRIILANMSNQFTGIFGHIVSNIEVIDRVANFGGEGGRPEKMAIVANCGVYKQ